MKFQLKYQVLILLSGLLYVTALSGVAFAGTLLLNGTWSYSENDQDNDGEFRQNYSATYTGRSDLTDLARLNGSLRYTRSIDEDNTTDRFSPSLTLLNHNDIYRFNLSGNYNISRDDDLRRDDWNWNSFLSSSWQEKLYLPSLSVFYGQSARFDDHSDGGQTDRAGGNATWNYFEWLGLGYSINWRDFHDKDSSAVNEVLTQSARLNAAEQFFDSRLGLSFSQSYLLEDQEHFAPLRDDGFSLVPVIVSQASYEETDDPLTGALTNDASFLLTDDDQPPTILAIDPANDPMNLGIKTDLRQVDVIYLSTAEDIEAYADNFAWDLYSSSNGVDWELREADIPFVYNSQEKRFEFDLESQVYRYLKLVADTSKLTPLQVTDVDELEVFRKIFGQTDANERSVAQTNFNLSYKLARTILFNYAFNYDNTEDDQNPDNSNIGNQGSISWNPSQYFLARINASRNDQQVEGLPDTINKTYSLSITSKPLSTLLVTLNASQNEDYPAESPDRITRTYTLYTSAELYEDLDASWDLTYTTIKEGSGNDSFGSLLRLTSRLRPTLLFTYENRYNRDLDSDNYTNRNTFALNWRVSDLFFINSTLLAEWKKNDDTKTGLSISTGITPNPRNRISATYGYSHEGEITTHVFGARWNWLITQVFNFQLSGSYFDSEDASSWSAMANLSFRYSNN
jgi:hypothetical protein